MGNKLVIAILSKEDFDEVIQDLNAHKIFVTKLSTSGGFLKKENVTIMIGIEEERLPEVLEVLRSRAGKRVETDYTMPPTSAPVPGMPFMQMSSSVPVTRKTGGVTLFVLDVDQMEKF